MLGVFDPEIVTVQLVVAGNQLVGPASRSESAPGQGNDVHSLVLGRADLFILAFLSSPCTLEVIAYGKWEAVSDRILFLNLHSEARQQASWKAHWQTSLRLTG